MAVIGVLVDFAVPVLILRALLWILLIWVVVAVDVVSLLTLAIFHCRSYVFRRFSPEHLEKAPF